MSKHIVSPVAMRLWRYACPIILWASMMLLFSCATLPDSVGEDVSAAELIRFAQDAYSDSNYGLAFLYYNTLLERHSDTRNVVLIANYEIGYLHFKLREYTQARERFEFLLAEYQRNTSGYPEWVYILSRKVIAKLPGSATE